MAMFINEKKMLEENIFQFEEKLKAPTARYLDSTPTFVTYFQIIQNITTTDEGYQDVASFIGAKSPIRYNKINEFPIYGIEQIVLQLQQNDQGLDSEFSAEGIILPGTIAPVQNEYFIIPYLHDSYMFRITGVVYDTILPDNFYKINFILEYIDSEQVEKIHQQVQDDYSCVFDNIGTEEKCIIKQSSYKKIQEIQDMYNDIAQTYLSIFYSEKHNCILGECDDGKKLYDPLMTEFINKHSLFNRKKDFTTLLFTNQWDDSKRRIKYEKSVYRFIERRLAKLVNNFPYTMFPSGYLHESTFYRWSEKNVWIADIPTDPSQDQVSIFSNEFVTSIKLNGFVDSEYAILIQKFVRNDVGINDIPLTLNEELLYLNGSLEVFFFTPIIMYIIQTVINEEISKTK